jgi:ribonuclease D
VLEELKTCQVLAIDTESNGLFVYRPELCIVQLAWQVEQGLRIVLIDSLRVPLEILQPILGSQGPKKILHDLYYDARLLAESGWELANVADTSVMARLLGKQQLGLANLLKSELEVEIHKKFQQFNWATRPLTADHLSYLANDVLYLEALHDKLWEQVEEQAITQEVIEETNYKLDEARKTPAQPPPPFTRMKNLDKLLPEQLSVAKNVYQTREQAASEINVPAFKVASDQFLLSLITEQPQSLTALKKLPQARGNALRFGSSWIQAIRQGLQDGKLSEEEQQLLVRPTLARPEVQLRKRREDALRTFRKQFSGENKVNEQAVLPGHCLSYLVSHPPTSLEELSQTPGFGQFRVQRIGQQILDLMKLSEEE